MDGMQACHADGCLLLASSMLHDGLHMRLAGSIEAQEAVCMLCCPGASPRHGQVRHPKVGATAATSQRFQEA